MSFSRKEECSPLRYVVLDFETYSALGIVDHGSAEYSRCSSTRLLCAAWRCYNAHRVPDSEQTHVYRSWRPRTLEALQAVVEDPKIIKVAHNVAFEFSIVTQTLGWKTDISQWYDTAVMLAQCSYPRSLEKGAAALGLVQQKDPAGKALILKLCTPAGAGVNHAESEYEKLLAYCVQDTRVQGEIFQRLPLLSAFDHRAWLANMRMNLRGFKVDRELAEGAVEVAGRETVVLHERCKQITGGLAPTQVAKLHSWLVDRGYTGANLSASERAGQNLNTLAPEVIEVLQIRGEASKSSVAKYQAALNRSVSDGRCRDTMVFYGAHTGRDAAVGFQPHNLPKPPDNWREVYARHIDEVAMGWCSSPAPMVTLSHLIRGTICAHPGRKFLVGDFSGIELRVLFWLAGHTKGLDMIRAGQDLYKAQASDIYGVPEANIGKHERQLGKAAVLGSGFGMGLNGEKFVSMAKQIYQMDVSLDLAKQAVASYRRVHAPVVAFWKVLEQGSVSAILHPNIVIPLGTKLSAKFDGDTLMIRLPAGRVMRYPKARLVKTQTMYGEKLELRAHGVVGSMKAFEEYATWGGTLAENVTQAVARDVMYAAVIRLEDSGFHPVLTVHDEVVVEEPIATPIAGFEHTMAMVPSWASGLPIACEFWEGGRYGK